MIDNVTPVVLSYNEAANIGRTLDQLRWAATVVVLDSGSTDETKEIALRHANVKWFERAFDNHRAQWAHAIDQTGITTEFVLALDADMQVTEEFAAELQQRFLAGDFAGGEMGFVYAYYGRALAGSLYPNQIRLFRRRQVLITQVDHSQHFAVRGAVYKFRSRLIHDDRKSLDQWLAAQVSYQELNDLAIRNGGPRRFRDYLRRSALMPPVMATFAYLRAGGPLGGAAAARYAYERLVCESLLALRLLNRRLKEKDTSSPAVEGGSANDVRNSRNS
jgi:glycosyltransferase involved in cell wall biosynthesis